MDDLNILKKNFRIRIVLPEYKKGGIRMEMESGGLLLIIY